ncbi:hypothetical protein BDW59DRAFT_163620 [Aspergillus cavernicola]|uniref:CorA-like transporter domain-containing protein n=1 Tax=Aspergillus cavernicola TaxID=176166 RepID=A0ABR4I547_9EURO
MNRHLLQKANANSGSIFRAKPNRPQLDLSILDRIQKSNGKWALQVSPRTQINQGSELEEARTQGPNEVGRIYTIRHMRTWSTVDISRELFDRLLELYQVFPEFWRVVLTFGLKPCENEYGFPIPQSRQSIAASNTIQELAYVIRRVEQNGRLSPECPWSIRQTGIYQKLVRPEDKSQTPSSLFFLVAPSSVAESNVVEVLSGIKSDDADAVTSSFSVHICLVAEGLVGWMDYMCWLEEQLKIKETRALAPTCGDPRNRPVEFVEKDRQNLKQLEDYITDLLVIFHTEEQNIRRLKAVCQKTCSAYCVKIGPCSCHQSIEEFENYATEAQSYRERAGVLQTRVRSVQNLLSDLLGYEEVRALRELATASRDESADIRKLTERSVQDGIAVKVLTIIGLVFMSLSLVGNFFSTQFVKTDERGLHVSSYVWVMIAAAALLTALVIIVWRLCQQYEYSKLQHVHPARQQSWKSLLWTDTLSDKETEPIV